MSDDKNYIIDPLTCLCKIALLYFMPEKTRLAINHHVLHIQKYDYYQWIERMKNGDSRIDISMLNTPLLKAIKWYILDNPERISMEKETIDNIHVIAHYSILALQKLQNYTYHNDQAIKIILQYFVNLLRDALQNSWNDDDCIKIESHINILSDKIKTNIDVQTIISISKMMSDADKLQDRMEDASALIDCVHKLLLNRDTHFVKLMKEFNTSL